MSEPKKRKMEDASSSSVKQEAEGVAATGNVDSVKEETDLSMVDVDDLEASVGASSSPPADSAADLAPMLAQLPSTLTLLQSLAADIRTCKLPQFHGLRKEVLRLAAALENSHFLGETKDEAQKRQYRRKEKQERAARELRQKTADQKYINSVALRNSRIQALNALVEPEAWGDKKGDSLLMPGEGAKLLMAPTAEPSDSAMTDASSAAANLPSSSISAEMLAAANSIIPTAEVLEKAAGPQSYTYPTVVPESSLAQDVSASSSQGNITKPFVKTGGNQQGNGSGSILPANTAAPSGESSASILVPALPIVEKAGEGKQLSKTQLKKLGAAVGEPRQGKKANFVQEGVHVNQEVLEAAKKKDQESKSESATDAPSAAAASPSPSASDVSDPVYAAASTGQPEFGPVLNNPRSCYCCKSRFYQLHFFYSEFCGPCARLNYAKRKQMADLKGKVILLTGSRVKIGFRCGLRLLRCGATLIATSRFPHDTAKRYAEEKDFNDWKDRLHIFGLDLRDLKSVVKLSEILMARYQRLDAIINNAAQTVRRPPMYYRHLIPIETMSEKEMPDSWKEVVKGDFHDLAGKQHSNRLKSDEKKASSTVTVEDISHVIHEIIPSSEEADKITDAISKAANSSSSSAAAAASSSTAPKVDSAPPTPNQPVEPSPSPEAVDVFHRQDDLNAALHTSSNRAAAMSQVAVLPSDAQVDSALFPVNKFDVTGQQLDLRSENSWNLTLDQVDPSELVEVFAINALSPFILNSRLKPLMMKGGAHSVFGPSVQVTDKYIINVSAMEGKFYRHKSPYHPHTNAAKAALNMLTRTSSQEYAQHRIYMNSVDTGWINDENPYETAKRLFESHNFQTPIDEEDAMARILDPLLTGVNTGVNCFGKFFKDYHETEW